MSGKEHGIGHIIQSLVVNVLIAAIKAVAALFTGSGAMLAEAIHSFADCGNQVLLLVGVKQARKPADEIHPLGYGRAIYFWSFMVAMLLFSVGGAFSIYEGVHKTLHPDPVEHVGWGMGILAVSLVLEGWSVIGNIKELNARRKAVPFFRYLKETKDSDLVVVFGENAAAVLGLFFALAALLLAWTTGNARWDGIGSALVGVVLVSVAIFLAKEISSLLLGESADGEISKSVHRIAEEQAKIERVLQLITIQQGPGEVVVAVKLAFASELTADEVCDAINAFEDALRKEHHDVRWCFVEPDIPRSQRAARSLLPP